MDTRFAFLSSSKEVFVEDRMAHRDEWSKDTCYTFPGAIQYYGPTEVCDLTTRTLALEKE